MTLNATVKSIQNIMRKDVGVDGDAQRIGQLSWILFLKILDDHELEHESSDKTYQSPIPDRLRWHNWAGASNLAGEELLNFINNDLFPSLKNLPIDVPTPSLSAIVRSVFEDTHNYMKSGDLLRQILDKMNANIHFKGAKERHLLGDIYEKILQDLQGAGYAGEFYTPRAITEFVVDMVDPKLGEKVLDPACGTGGFLTCSIEHIRGNYVKNVSDEEILQKSISGIEKKSLPHLLCITNMFLHGIEIPSHIRHGNALAQSLESYGPNDQVDIIVTNPPFGADEEDGVDTNFPEKFRSKETTDLFFLLIMRLLKDGGRAAIVLPDGFLFGEGAKTRIKEKLLEECNLHTVVRLPKGVFRPYTDIKTNILFFIKGAPTKETFYYEHPYPPGYKSYSKTKPIRIEEFKQEAQWWAQREEGNFAWKITIDEIKTNGYNLDFKNPNNNDVFTGDFDELKVYYGSLQEEVIEIRKELKKCLQNSIRNEEKNYQGNFFAYFDAFLETPKGIQKLRELILHFAMRGKLVPHNPSEESATDLYEQIKNIKNRLDKDGLLRQSSISSQLALDKLPFTIPETWKWVRLNDIGQIVGGGTPDTNYPEYFADNGIPWLTPADLYQLPDKFIERGKRDISKLGLQKSGARLLPRGSVLFSSRAPIGYVAIAANDLATNQGFKSCVPYIIEMNHFVYYFFKFASKEIEKNASGTTFKEVSGKVIQQVLFPLPPLEEQKRIVTKIDELMTILNRFEEKYVSLQHMHEVMAETLAYFSLNETEKA